MESVGISRSGISTTEMRIQTTGDESSDVGNGSSLVLRKIDFHLARKQFTGFSKANSGDLRIETLTPDAGRKRLPGLDPGKKKVDGSDFVENGLDPELNFGITFRRIGAGLENLGNTCFLNSVLQCLTYTEPLAAYLQSGKHQNSCHIAGFCALCAIQKHVSRALQSTGRSLVPKDLVSNLRCISRNFRNARQEDAHEYMVNLLESMHKCCLPSGVPSESPAAYEKSLVHKIFGGRLRSQVECQHCFYCSNKFDPFLDVSLEIVKADTLPVALRNFTAAEMLDGGEKHYQCQRCKQKVKAKKRLTVHKAPNVLTIHLKRFHAHDPGRKVDKKVLFDRSLDMKPFVSGSYEGDLKYSLYGVLVHFGHNTHSGHYVCFVRTSSGMWYLLNDNEVRQVSEKTVLEQKAYMLFYVRDRQNIASRKLVDASQKDNMKATVSSNIANLVVRQFSKEHVDNGSVGNRSLVTNPSATVNQKDASSVVMSTETLSKNELFQPNNGLMMPKCSVPVVDPVLKSSSVPLLVDPSKDVSLPNPNLGECLLPSAPSVKSNGDTSKLENASTTTVAKTSDCNGPSTGCNGPENSATDKLVTNETLYKINPVLHVEASNKVPSEDSSHKTVGEVPGLALYMDSSDKTLSKMDPVKSPNKPSCESTQDGVISKKSTSGNTLSDQAGGCGQGIVHELVESPTLSVIPNECFNRKAPDCTPPKKLKKRLLMCRRMHLGSILFRASLGLRKKKKHKKSKRRTLETQNLIKEHLLDNNCFSSEVGPSTSEKSLTISSGSKNSRKKQTKSVSRKADGVRKCFDDSLMHVADEELRKRNDRNGAVLPIDEQLQKSSISVSKANQQDARELDFLENSKRDVLQNRTMSILTQGLEEMTVARWDGIELPPSRIVESSSMKNQGIGYVLDEWDEEYDRGKRKKLRQAKHNFGGSNPFQEIATKKTQFKKAKMDQSSSGNQPFRI